MPGYLRFGWLFAVVLLISVPSHAGKVIVSAFGDSITRGYPYQQGQANGIPDNGGYIPYLQLRLRTDAQWDVGVLNYGYSGERVTTEGFKRFNTTYSNPVLDSKPDYVLIMEGTNDLPLGMVGPSVVVDSLRYIVNQVLLDGRTPILGTLIPRFDHFSSSSNITGTNSLIRSLAESKGIVLADLYKATNYSYWQIYLTEDQLHPNLNGYSLIANVWYGALVQAKAIQDDIQRQLELERQLAIQRKAAVSAVVSSLLLD